MKFTGLHFIILIKEICLTVQWLSFSKVRNDPNLRFLYNLPIDVCRRECMARPSCHSINYFRRAKKCELNKMADVAVGQSKSIGSVYSAKSDWLDNEFGSCTCATGKKCINRTDGCIWEECDVLPNRNVANIQSVGSKSVFSVKCVEDVLNFYLFGQGLNPETVTSRLTCMPNGSWKMKTPSGGPCLGIAFIMAPGTGKDPYQEWKHGEISPSVPIYNVYYRSGIIDAWDYLSVDHIRFSVYKNQEEVKYIVFNGTESTSLNWLAQTRVLDSSWQDLKDLQSNFFSIEGTLDHQVTRRFFVNNRYGGCVNDAGWFAAVVRGVCNWEPTVGGTVPLLVYSTLNTVGVYEVSFDQADTVYILLNFSTY